MEFRTFVTAMIRIPCQIVRTGRRLIFRLLNGNDRQPMFWRLVDVLQLLDQTEALTYGRECFGSTQAGCGCPDHLPWLST